MDKTQQLMTKNPITIGADSGVKDAYVLMKTWGVRHLPVLSAEKKLVGIISDRDVQRAMTVKKTAPFQNQITIDPTLKVEDFMSWPVLVVAETTSIKRVAEEMVKQKVSSFVVENGKGEVRGIITTHDILSSLIADESRSQNLALKAISHYFTDAEV